MKDKNVQWQENAQWENEKKTRTAKESEPLIAQQAA